MKLCVCDAQNGQVRQQLVRQWCDAATQKGWLACTAKSSTDVDQCEDVSLALIHTSENWSVAAYSRLNQRSPTTLVCVYSGGTTPEVRPWNHDPAVPYCSTDHLSSALGGIFSEWGADADQAWLFQAVSGFGALEAALEVLSALLPIGLLWEAHGKSSALEVLKSADQDRESSALDFEGSIQQYVCKRLKGEDGESEWEQISEKDERSLSQLDGAEAVKTQLNKLCGSESPSEWTEKLTSLRDLWLAQADKAGEQ